jgi:hypothetical protein
MLATCDTILDYLELIGGKDVLVYDTPEEALRAAQAIRDELRQLRMTSSVSVEARFSKVLLSRR